ncbi:uncharacterized protein [Rutidosis leptorrhynchoides]|uniref:uncharacterized protein n=1 Tax=Rutidosis leptorrhynchoides TaxID=125765 RepID=UPI003A9A103C
MVKYILSSLPLYFFSLFRSPSRIINILESLRRKFFWGGTGSSKKVCWVKWDRALLPYKMGGLNIGFLSAKNLFLIGKWWWRFKTKPNSFWAKIIKSVYGTDGGLGDAISRSRLYQLEINKHASIAGRILHSGSHSIGNWQWFRPPRGRAIDDLDNLNQLIAFVFLSDIYDTWKWSLDNTGKFTTKALSLLIDEKKILADSAANSETIRNKALPQKVDIFICRALMGRIPTRIKLDKHPISIRCFVRFVTKMPNQWFIF